MHIIKMLLTTRFCSAIKQFCNSNFCHKTIIYSNGFNFL